MKEYQTNALRNIAVLGHLGSGKTSLVESLLYITKVIDKKGEVERKNTVSDYAIEEQSRQTSLSTSLIPIEWNGYKLNFLDLPGSDEFVGELNNVLNIVKGAIIIIDATKGIEVGTEKLWDEVSDRGIPTIIFINKMDKENIKFDELIENIRERFGKKVVPFAWPVGKKDAFDGFVNVVEMKARIYDGVNCVDAPIWEERRAKVEELNYMIKESVAETSEELLDKFIMGEELTLDEINNGLRTGVLAGDLYPVLVGSVTKNIGVHTLLDMVVNYMPAPQDLKAMVGVDPKTNQPVTRQSLDTQPFSAYVFKTIIDSFVGSINFFKIYSGTLKVAQEVYVPNTDTTIKMGTIGSMMGKNQLPVDVLHAGDIGAVAKMPELATGYTFCDKKNPVLFEKLVHPTPTIYVAIQPKNKADEDKISSALQKLNQEDETFEIKRNPETSQLLVGGQGMTHLGFVLEKMKNMFRVELEITDPKIVYRETIRSKGEAQGRHKKQSGGAGQFGDVWIRFEPTDKEFEFEEDVFGGSVPRNYFPAVEKGLIETLEKGPLAGFPVIGVKATLYDGSYHAVDSNELSFKLAAKIAFENAVKKLRPTILEPIMRLDITVKDDFIGDVLGDINKRRGQVLGMEPKGRGLQMVSVEAPEAEITKYATDLRAMTQGSGRFTREFVRYAEVPDHLIEKIVAEYKKQQ